MFVETETPLIDHSSGGVMPTDGMSLLRSVERPKRHNLATNIPPLRGWCHARPIYQPRGGGMFVETESL